MLEEIVTVDLPVDEQVAIKRQRIENGNRDKRIAIVTGIQGDELDGQYICYKLIKKLKENIKDVNGIVDVYPAINPLGIDSITRGIPMFDLDMNRVFPGYSDGAMAEYVAASIVKDISGSDICIDLHSSNEFIKEFPQVRIAENNKSLIPYAKLLNTDFIWIYESATVLKATLAYSLNQIGVPTLALEMGIGNRINREYCDQILSGIFNLMNEMGIWNCETRIPKEPMLSTEGEVEVIHSKHSGIFIHGEAKMGLVRKGDHIGDIVNPAMGEILESVYAPFDGTMFSLREHPVVYQGAVIARIMGDKK